MSDKMAKDEIRERFEKYRRTQIAEMADWEPGFDMYNVSVSTADREAGSPKLGDKIARNPANHADRWLVAKAYFDANFEAYRAGAEERPQLGTCDTTDWPHLMSDGSGKKRPHEKRDSCTNWHAPVEPERGDGWISVKERLPEPKQRVMIWFFDNPIDGYEIRFGEISCGHFRPEGGNGNFDDRITHWRPLPDPPKESRS